MLNTQAVKKSFYYLVQTINTTSIGRRICQVFLDAQLSLKSTVHHAEVCMDFVTPNLLSHYRAISFSVKEPDTLEWINFLQSKITVMPIALSEKIGISQFNLSTTSWGGALSTFDKDFDQHGNKLNSVFEYRTIGLSLDEVAEIYKIPFPQYLKIDVDGLEHLILRGGALILKHVDSVLIEISDEFKEQATESFSLLSSAGLIQRARFTMDGVENQCNQWWTRSTS